MALVDCGSATFTAAKTDRSDKVEIRAAGGESPVSWRDGGMNALMFYVEGDSATGSAKLEVFITEDVAGTEKVVWTREVTITPSAYRTKIDGSAGNYLCYALDAVTSKECVDLCRHVSNAPNVGTKVYMSCVSLTTIASLRVRVRATRSI